MVPTQGMTMTLEGVPGEFIRNKNIMGDPTKSKKGYASRSFTLHLTPEYAKAFEDKGFPLKMPENAREDTKPYIAINLFPEPKYNHPASEVVSDNGSVRKRLYPSQWIEFDERPIEYVDLELETYKNTQGNISVKCVALYFHTKISLIRKKYPDAYDDEYEPAPFQ